MSIQSPSYLIGRSGAGDLAEERMTAEERGENTPIRNGGENTLLRNGPSCTRRTLISVPVAASHMRAVRSSEAVTMQAQLGENSAVAATAASRRSASPRSSSLTLSSARSPSPERPIR
jgi:hypothetical protein